MNERNNLPSLDVMDSSQANSQYFGTPREIVLRYTHCALCGSNLHFSHSADFARNLTVETAKCPECGIRIRRVLHKLQ